MRPLLEMNRQYVVLAVSALVFGFVHLRQTSGQRLEGGDTSHLPNHGICESIDVRNVPENLNQLRYCTIVAGDLWIVLIDRESQKTDNFTFPLLREVTGALVLHRVNGLKSIGKLFPNLILIRGNNLLHNYALVVYEMPHLSELGLRSLMMVQHGFVNIGHNAMLCYVKTVNWTAITGHEKGNSFIANGMNACPSSGSCRGCDNNTCWSSRYCQRSISPDCHPKCLGGCSVRNNVEECYRCKDFINEGMCVEKCPDTKLHHRESHMCINTSVCQFLFGATGFPWNGDCIHSCPKNFSSIGEGTNKTCEFCGDKCMRECDGFEIRTLSDLQLISGCNRVKGAVHIMFLEQMAESKVMDSLMKHLSELWIIRDYLKITRSVSIKSLNFLKNLKLIEGKALLTQKYSIVVNNMENLQSLVDFGSNPPFKIQKGKMQFHFNPNLCLQEIEKFSRALNNTLDPDDAPLLTNGNEGPCHFIDIEAHVKSVEESSAVVSWTRINHESVEPLGYLVYYIDESDEPITHYGKDTCYNKGWNTIYVEEESDLKNEVFEKRIDGLSGYTEYAFYVETYNKNHNPKNPVTYVNGRSSVGHFKTKMEEPVIPVELDATSTEPNSITISWKDDPTYKGIVTYHHIQLAIQPEKMDLIDSRDYCLYPPTRDEPEKRTWRPLNPYKEPDEKKPSRYCACTQEDWLKGVEEAALLDIKVTTEKPRRPVIDVDKFCVFGSPDNPKDREQMMRCRMLFSKRPESNKLNSEKVHGRQERNVKKVIDFHKLAGKTPPSPSVQNITVNDRQHFFSTNYTGQWKNYTLYNLEPYAKYLISVSACRNEHECGPAAFVSQRAMPDYKRDIAPELSFSFQDYSSVFVSWPEPKMSNGAILSYTLEYRKIAGEFTKQMCVTRKSHELNRFSYKINLEPGSYILRLRVHSLGGDGEFSKQYFVETLASSSVVWWIVLGFIVFLAGVGATWSVWKRSVAQARVDRRLSRENSERLVLFSSRRNYEEDDRIEIFEEYMR